MTPARIFREGSRGGLRCPCRSRSAVVRTLRNSATTSLICKCMLFSSKSPATLISVTIPPVSYYDQTISGKMLPGEPAGHAGNQPDQMVTELEKQGAYCTRPHHFCYLEIADRCLE